MKSKTALSALIIVLSILGLGVLKWHRNQSADVFPSKPLVIICPFSAGGGTDLLCRKLAQQIEHRIDQSVLVSNLTGGGGAVGHAAGQMANPNGHELLMATFELVSLPIQGLVPFSYQDFDLFILINIEPASLAVRQDFQAENFEEFIRVSHQTDGVSIGNSGSASVWHLAAELLTKEARIQSTHVPFNGASQAITALLGGHVDAVVASPAELKPYVESGQLRILTVMSEQRLKQMPNIATAAEYGVPVTFGTWRGITLPKGVPKDRKEQLRALIEEAIHSEDFVEFVEQSGMTIDLRYGEAFETFVSEQSSSLGGVMSTLGLTQ